MILNKIARISGICSNYKMLTDTQAKKKKKKVKKLQHEINV